MCRSATAVKVELTGPLLTVVGRMHTFVTAFIQPRSQSTHQPLSEDTDADYLTLCHECEGIIITDYSLSCRPMSALRNNCIAFPAPAWYSLFKMQIPPVPSSGLSLF